ncbi:hypothetical protein CRENBAI_014388 [Crenichthys baileyi]|uniref:Uncharacterized protein n=1 Tax=Crenichthys baileyi TaxID=28760 RepID=A0AAV9RRV2_9TELE
MHGEEVEILPSPMLLQKMEEAGLSLPVSPGLIPGRRRSSLPPSVSATSTSATFQHRSSQPEFGAARFLCPSRRRRRRRRGASVPVSEGCANASSSLPEGWITASRLSPVSPGFLLDAPAPASTEGRLHALVTTADSPQLLPAVTPAGLSLPTAAPAEPSTFAAASAEHYTPTKEANPSFVPVCYSPYTLEFMSQVLRRGKVLTDLAIHLLVCGDSPEHTLEVLGQLIEWKTEWGHYSPSSMTVEILESERRRIIEGTGRAGSTDSKHVAKPLDSLHAAKPLDSLHAAKPLDSLHAAKPLDSLHAAKPLDSLHAAKPLDSLHAAKPLDSLHAAKPLDSLHAAKPLDSVKSPEPQHTVKLHEPQIRVPEFREGFEDEPPLTLAPGQTDCAPGQTDCAPGQTDCAPGQTDCAPGQTDCAPGQTDCAPGQTDCAPGQTDLLPVPPEPPQPDYVALNHHSLTMWP